MIERKFVQMNKDEFTLKEFVRKELGKGKISSIGIERTPVGEKILVRTSKPGLIIGRRGEKIINLTSTLKREFKMDNPHIEIQEIDNPDLDAWAVADEIALALERFGPIRFKMTAYKMLERIKRAGALGAEIRLGGKLPGERAKSWRFSYGLLKKTGDPAKVVDRARIAAQTIPGSVGIKVEIMPPNAYIVDKLEIKDFKIVSGEAVQAAQQAQAQQTTETGKESGEKPPKRKKSIKKKTKSKEKNQIKTLEEEKRKRGEESKEK
ncbi:30S ribosomal protein S3 [Candidatus Pacearchaeota archaeon]|nr:30S ribosomal protein S3 [Candidatus Pacearchaeota archaeon]